MCLSSSKIVQNITFTSENCILTLSRLIACSLFHLSTALAQAIVSMTYVAVMKLMKARNTRDMVLRPHPARANTAGNVRAPVPTIKLNMYVKPT